MKNQIRILIGVLVVLSGLSLCFFSIPRFFTATARLSWEIVLFAAFIALAVLIVMAGVRICRNQIDQEFKSKARILVGALIILVSLYYYSSSLLSFFVSAIFGFFGDSGPLVNWSSWEYMVCRFAVVMILVTNICLTKAGLDICKNKIHWPTYLCLFLGLIQPLYWTFLGQLEVYFMHN